MLMQAADPDKVRMSLRSAANCQLPIHGSLRSRGQAADCRLTTSYQASASNSTSTGCSAFRPVPSLI